MLLGWSLDDKTEFFTRRQMIDNFSLERVTKAPASFDPKKLWAFQDHYMQQLSSEEKVERMLPFLVKAGLLKEADSALARQLLSKIVAAAGDRLKVAGDILAYADFFFLADDAYPFDAESFEKHLKKPESAEQLAKFRDRLAALSSFDVESLERMMHEFLEAEQIKIGAVIHAIRVAVTGKPVGPGLYDCLAILGKEKCLARIDRALGQMA
jgi:glutamyl-tRNA synthetase